MISVIFVPILCAILVGILIILLSPRRKFDAPSAAQYQLKSALVFISEKNEIFSLKDFKKLNMLVNKARSFIERAKFEDIYDMTIPQDACVKARAITQSLALVCPQPSHKYLQIVAELLRTASDYIFSNCGVTALSVQKMNLSSYSKKSKEDKARAHLESLNK